MTDSRERIKSDLEAYSRIVEVKKYLSGRLDRATDPAARAELSERVERQRIRADNARRGALDLIYMLTDPRQIEVLELRYIDGLTVEETADRLNYSARHVLRLTRAAVDNLEKYSASPDG